MGVRDCEKELGNDMHHFFVAPEQIGEKKITITGSDVNHIRNVLRMEAGEQITVSGGEGKEYRCEVLVLEPDRVEAGIMWVQETEAELPSKTYLFQGLPKGDKMELIIQKAVELGVYEIIPVATKRAVVKLDKKKSESKRKRWQSISESAAKQSKRLIVPEITSVMSFREAVEYAAGKRRRKDCRSQKGWRKPGICLRALYRGSLWQSLSDRREVSRRRKQSWLRQKGCSL